MMWKFFILLLCLSFSTIWSVESKVLAFAGSLRADSVNKKLVIEAASIARDMGADVKFIDLKDYPIPLYDGDLEKECGMPEGAKRIREMMIDSQVILIASPEYNGSLSALLKNTIDWTSRNGQGGSSREAFEGKKFVIMSSSPGAGGGARGLVHLRAVIEAVGGTVLSQQFVLPGAYSAFNEEGKLKDQKLRTDLQNFIKNSLQPS